MSWYQNDTTKNRKFLKHNHYPPRIRVSTFDCLNTYKCNYTYLLTKSLLFYQIRSKQASVVYELSIKIRVSTIDSVNNINKNIYEIIQEIEKYLRSFN